MSEIKNFTDGTCVCPWWLIHVFDNPVRRIFQKPEIILNGLVRAGDHCLDLGCGYGFFTIPMARMVGPEGLVTAADLQARMLEGVKRRAMRSGLIDRIRFHRVDNRGFNLDDAFDFILAFWMVHEVPDAKMLFEHLHTSIKPGGLLLIAEPKGHVGEDAYARTIGCAEKAGFRKIGAPRVSFSRAAVMKKV